MNMFEKNNNLYKSKQDLESTGKVKKFILPHESENNITSIARDALEKDQSLNDEQKKIIEHCISFLASSTILDTFENTPEGHEERTEFEHTLGKEEQKVYDSNRLRANNVTAIISIVKKGFLDWLVKDSAVVKSELAYAETIERRAQKEYRDMNDEDKADYQHAVRDLAESICTEYVAYAYHKKSA